MADINIEEKRSTPVWAWIVGLLVIALLIWAVLWMMNGRTDEQPITPPAEDPAVTAPATGEAAAPIGEAPDAAGQTAAMRGFMADCHQERSVAAEDPARVRDYAASCFQQLATSLQNMSRRQGADSNVDQHTQALEAQARELRDSPAGSPQQATLTRQAALSASNALEAVQRAWFPEESAAANRVEQARQSAQQIQPAQPGQVLGHVRTFFRQAGDALNAMTPSA